ncbi:glycosyltransferase family 4 protein [Mangrovibacterium diazotrophicum]|nr:glycosyltransferase family 1 protein [Mangrovibacterium diazotrophicum]
MKIFFDFYEIAITKGKSIGIYNYALSVLRNLALNDKLKILVACSGENADQISKIERVEVLEVNREYPNFQKRLLWRSYNAINMATKYECDIYYSPKGFAPGFVRRKRAPYIVLTVHDMIPFYYKSHFPGHFGAFENMFVTKSLYHSIKVANEVITISNYSKEMIKQHCNRKNGIEVIYNGVNSFSFGSNGETECAPYIFSITSSLPHKNRENLLKGYIEYRKNNAEALPLKLCGLDPKWLGDAYQDQGIECMGFVDEKTLMSLYRNARLFVFIPLIEGFGFPPFEAMSFGTPSLVSDIPVFREILGPMVKYVDPLDCKTIGNAIKETLDDKQFRQNFDRESPKFLQKYSWKDCSNEISELFEKVVGNSKSSTNESLELNK